MDLLPHRYPLKGPQRFNLEPNRWHRLPDNRLKNPALRANPCVRRSFAPTIRQVADASKAQGLPAQVEGSGRSDTV
jgi:hypothetical protein